MFGSSSSTAEHRTIPCNILRDQNCTCWNPYRPYVECFYGSSFPRIEPSTIIHTLQVSYTPLSVIRQEYLEVGLFEKFPYNLMDGNKTIVRWELLTIDNSM